MCSRVPARCGRRIGAHRARPRRAIRGRRPTRHRRASPCLRRPPRLPAGPRRASPARMALATRSAEFLETPGLTGAIAHHARGELAAGTRRPRPGPRALPGRSPRARPATPYPERAAVAGGCGTRPVRLGPAREAAAARRASTTTLPCAAGARTPSRSRCAPWRTVDAATGAVAAAARGAAPPSTGVRADRLAAQIETDLAGLLLLAQAGRRRPRRSRCCARRGRTPARGAVAAAGPGPPAARAAGRGPPHPVVSETHGVADRGRARVARAGRRRPDQPADRRPARGHA